MAHSVATPVLLCHKEPAQGTKRPLLKGISCLSLVHYGLREGGFRSGKGPLRGNFHARKESIIRRSYAIKPGYIFIEDVGAAEEPRGDTGGGAGVDREI